MMALIQKGPGPAGNKMGPNLTGQAGVFHAREESAMALGPAGKVRRASGLR